MNWQPNPQVVHTMVNLLSDIRSEDTNRQVQILEEFTLLQTRPDFALYLVYLTSGCPGMQIQISENARIAACLRLGRVFRDKESIARDNLDLTSATYIRDECFKYITTTHTLIKRCVIDVLAYLCIFQRLQTWQALFVTLSQWMGPQIDPQPGTPEYNLKDTAYELLQRIFAEICNDDDLAELFSDDSWAPIFNPIFHALLNGVVDKNERIRHNSVQALHDTVASKPTYIFNSPQNTLTFITNLYLLASNDHQFPKSQQLVFETLSSIATMELRYVLGFNFIPKQVTVDQIGQQSAQNPIPKITQQLDFNSNIFALIDNLLLLCIQCIKRSHNNCGDEFTQCDVIYDRVTFEAISFVISIVSTSQWEHPNSVALRTAIMRRHINELLPRLYASTKYTGCDVIDAETQIKQQLLEQNEQVMPHFHSGGIDDSDGEHGDGGENGNDDDDDDDDDDENPMAGTLLRRVAASAVTYCNILCPEQSLAIFLSFIDSALNSQHMVDRECGLYLLGLYGSSFPQQLKDKLSNFIPSLINVLSQPDQHPLVHSIVAWVFGRLAEIVIHSDSNGLKAADGRTIIQIFISQAITILTNPTERNVETALCQSLEHYAEYNECYSYYLEFYYQLTELCIKKLTNPISSKHTIVTFTSLLGKLIDTYEDSLESFDLNHFLQSVVTPYLQHCLTISYENEVLGDWFICLQKIILNLPISFLQHTAAPIYFRCLEVMSQITPFMLEALAASEQLNDRYDNDIAWQLTNTCATVCDCINSLIERLEENFAQICFLPPPDSITQILQSCYQRCAWLTHGDVSQLPQYGTLPLLCHNLQICLSYRDTSTRQGAFAVVGELCDKLSTVPIVKQFCFNALPIIEISITMEASLVDLLSNAAWCIRTFARCFGEELFSYQRPKANDPQSHYFPMHNLVKKLTQISVTQISSIQCAHSICQITLSSLAITCHQGLLNVLLLHSENDMKGLVSVLNKVFQTVSFSSTYRLQWEILAGYSFLLPLIATNPQCGMSIVTFLTCLNDTIGITHDKNAHPEANRVDTIKSNLGQIFAANAAFWGECFNHLTPDQQQNLRNILQL